MKKLRMTIEVDVEDMDEEKRQAYLAEDPEPLPYLQDYGADDLSQVFDGMPVQDEALAGSMVFVKFGNFNVISSELIDVVPDIGVF